MNFKCSKLRNIALKFCKSCRIWGFILTTSCVFGSAPARSNISATSKNLLCAAYINGDCPFYPHLIKALKPTSFFLKSYFLTKFLVFTFAPASIRHSSISHLYFWAAKLRAVCPSFRNIATIRKQSNNKINSKIFS